ncbi:hypothetical protein [Roseovarius sp. 2305UL8-3]|uniref:hypothetical protein n=1 Tax=Roseovarius conchicola TaxID=3121636 RepID=UPI0035288B2A
MAAENGHGHALPSWFVEPGEGDFFAWFSLAMIGLAIYGIFYLYARFDRWAEHSAAGTPLAKTIPTMLTIALLYEVLPLGHFNILLPLAAILVALMADLAHFRFGSSHNDTAEPEHASETPPQEPSSPDDSPEKEPANA